MLRTHTHATKSVSARSIKRSFKLIDADAKVLGKVASEAAYYLQGKHKRGYVANLEGGDHVIVINAKNIVVTGRKPIQKQYTQYSGYPGGLRKESFQSRLSRTPTEVVRHAVSGMLPKNKLRDRRLSRLHVYPNADHPYVAQISS